VTVKFSHSRWIAAIVVAASVALLATIAATDRFARAA
jgi:hypothetical protein